MKPYKKTNIQKLSTLLVVCISTFGSVFSQETMQIPSNDWENNFNSNQLILAANNLNLTDGSDELFVNNLFNSDLSGTNYSVFAIGIEHEIEIEEWMLSVFNYSTEKLGINEILAVDPEIEAEIENWMLNLNSW